MKMGTIVYNEKIYNLDFMSDEEIKDLLKLVDSNKRKDILDMKNNNQ